MSKNDNLTIYGINGPIVTVKGKTNLFIHEMVYAGNEKLIGEVSSVSSEKTTIQIYENTSGLRIGEPIIHEGNLLCVTLGPGLLSEIYDGICRPLKKIEAVSGCFIQRGINIPGISFEKKWNVTLKLKPGDHVEQGTIFALCQETSVIEHRFPVPTGLSGTVIKVLPDGEYNVKEPLVTLKNDDGEEFTLCMLTLQPIRQARKVAKRLEPTIPLITGQRIIDSLFPIAKGGTAAIPGGFGTGKTITQHQLAKWSDADIIVYIGCGERGNEMTQVLEEFSELVDPRTGKSMLERTILIANTSNMPVAAREASIYSGVTLAEYYRDMGYNVAVMADSTSRWAEALREISGRLEEMPAEEGFPAYLPSKLSAFYERAGLFETMSGEIGSITIIGAVSPQGNDFSEPVTQNTKRFIRCYWALDKSLAYARHYPSINWTTSYSEYTGTLEKWFCNKFGPDYSKYRQEIQNVLNEEASLMEIVKLIGSDLLADEQKLILDVAKVIRVGFLQQNALIPEDSYVESEKQFLMMKYIIELYYKAKVLIARQIPASQLRESGIYDMLSKMKYDIPNDKCELFDKLWSDMNDKLSEIEQRYV